MKYKFDDTFPISIGIYLISFDGASKVYIGSTAKISKLDCHCGFRQRWNTHLNVLRRNRGGPALQAAYNKYGEDSMFFEVVEECVGPVDFVIEREQYYICKYNSYELGYNSCPKAGSILGIRRSKELKRRLSKIHTQNGMSKVKKHEAEVVALYNKGLSYREIRSKLSISNHLIRKILEINKIQRRDSTDYRKQKIYAYDRYGLLGTFDSIKECADHFKRSLVLVSQVLSGRAKTSKGLIFSKTKLTNKEVRQRFQRKKYETANKQ